VLGADLQERLYVPLTVEAGNRVAANQVKKVPFCQLIPKLLELDRLPRLSFGPQQRHHLPEHRDSGALFPRCTPRLSQNAVHAGPEELFVHLAVDQEFMQCFARTETQKPALFDCPGDINTSCGQVLLQSHLMGVGCDDDGCVTHDDSGPDVCCQHVEKKIVVGIKLDNVAFIIPARSLLTRNGSYIQIYASDTQIPRLSQM
jgi:hypothetical protein